MTIRKSERYHDEREKALRIIREKIIKQISEKSRLIRERATRKNKETKF